jgi:hypothetical protein
MRTPSFLIWYGIAILTPIVRTKKFDHQNQNPYPQLAFTGGDVVGECEIANYPNLLQRLFSPMVLRQPSKSTIKINI